MGPPWLTRLRSRRRSGGANQGRAAVRTLPRILRVLRTALAGIWVHAAKTEILGDRRERYCNAVGDHEIPTRRPCWRRRSIRVCSAALCRWLRAGSARNDSIISGSASPLFGGTPRRYELLAQASARDISGTRGRTCLPEPRSALPTSRCSAARHGGELPTLPGPCHPRTPDFLRADGRTGFSPRQPQTADALPAPCDSQS